MTAASSPARRTPARTTASAIVITELIMTLALCPPARARQAQAIEQAEADAAARTADVLRQAEQMATQARGPATPAERSGDPAAMARRFAAMPPVPQGAPPRLYVLVSFSMQPASLQRLAAQAAVLQVPLVLRGLAGDSLSATARKAADVVKAVPGASFEIDPAPFRRFGVTRIPSFMIATAPAACTGACVPEQDALVVTGDVTLDYALERLAQGSGASASVAERYLARLKDQR